MPGREEERASVVSDWLHDIRESGIWLAFAVVLVLGLVLAGLDTWRWDRDFANAMLAEMNAVVVELFIAGVVLAVWEYRRRRKGEILDLSKELFNLRLADERAAIDRKEEILQTLAERGRKPETLDHYLLVGARLNSFDLADLNIEYARLGRCMLIRARLAGSNLFEADLTEACLVEADLAGARLYEAKFSGALVSGADFSDADLQYADLRGVREMTCEQLTSAQNWQSAYRDPELACGAPVPDFDKRSLGMQLRERFRQQGNPTYPYVLATLHHEDGRTETVVADNDPV